MFPYAYVEENPVKLFPLLIIPHIVILIFFYKQFEGELTHIDKKNYLVVQFIFYFIPTTYYYMLRSKYSPAWGYNILTLIPAFVCYLSLVLDDKIMQYDRKYVHLNKLEGE